jgi:transketolase C-terminal domain/subunit
MWIDQTLSVDLSSTRLRQQLAAGERCDADLPAGEVLPALPLGQARRLREGGAVSLLSFGAAAAPCLEAAAALSSLTSTVTDVISIYADASAQSTYYRLIAR